MLTLNRWLVVYNVLWENHLIVDKGLVAHVLDCAWLTPIRSCLTNLPRGVWSFNRATSEWNLGLLIYISTSSISSTFWILIIDLCWVILFIKIVFTKLLGLVDVRSHWYVSRIHISYYIIWMILLSILAYLILVILSWLIVIILIAGYFSTNGLPLLVEYLTLSDIWEVLAHIVSLVSIKWIVVEALVILYAGRVGCLALDIEGLHSLRTGNVILWEIDYCLINLGPRS